MFNYYKNLHHLIFWLLIFVDNTAAKTLLPVTINSAITVTIPSVVLITGLNDIVLSPISTASNAAGNTTACVYTNVAANPGSYFVTATSANALGGVFRTTNGSSFLSYSAYWNSNASAIPTTLLSSGGKTVRQTGGSFTSQNCAGLANANFNLQFLASNLSAAAAASYTDTVSIVISPS